MREDAGFKQAGLAQKLGVSKETVYRYESNVQTPSLERAKRMAVILHTSLDYLVGLDNTYTLKLPPITQERKDVLREFLQVFLNKN